MKTPAAKFASSPLHATPTATAAPPNNAAKDAVCTPKIPSSATTSRIVRMTLMLERKYVTMVGSKCRLSSALALCEIRNLITLRPISQRTIAPINRSANSANIAKITAPDA